MIRMKMMKFFYFVFEIWNGVVVVAVAWFWENFLMKFRCLIFVLMNSNVLLGDEMTLAKKGKFYVFWLFFLVLLVVVHKTNN